MAVLQASPLLLHALSLELGAGEPTGPPPGRRAGPRVDVLQSSSVFQCLWPRQSFFRGKPHFVAPCHKRTQHLSVLPSIFPVYSQASSGAAPASLCQRALAWALPVSHLMFLCPCLLQRRAVRPSDGHLDVHRCHEHQETLRPGGHARWVTARGPD